MIAGGQPEPTRLAGCIFESVVGMGFPRKYEGVLTYAP